MPNVNVNVNFNVNVNDNVYVDDDFDVDVVVVEFRLILAVTGLTQRTTHITQFEVTQASPARSDKATHQTPSPN
jgi:hypothetical protein